MEDMLDRVRSWSRVEAASAAVEGGGGGGCLRLGRREAQLRERGGLRSQLDLGLGGID